MNNTHGFTSLSLLLSGPGYVFRDKIKPVVIKNINFPQKINLNDYNGLYPS